MNQPSVSSRAKVRRNPKRARYDEASIHAILDAGFLCHIAAVVDGQPVVIPTSYGRIGNTLYLHGARQNRMINALANGAPASIGVTHLDGLVLARSLMHHSANYRSVVMFGKARWVEDEAERVRGLKALTEQMLPGRYDESRVPNEAEMKITSVVAFEIEDASAKVRAAPPKDDPEDEDPSVWAGVVPLSMKTGMPIPDEITGPEVRIPPSVKLLVSS
ncbi:MAG: pyridoxamine 5'-phosphate oxidase family protein [Bacteroidota bacterium]